MHPHAHQPLLAPKRSERYYPRQYAAPKFVVSCSNRIPESKYAPFFHAWFLRVSRGHLGRRSRDALGFKRPLAKVYSFNLRKRLIPRKIGYNHQALTPWVTMPWCSIDISSNHLCESVGRPIRTTMVVSGFHGSIVNWKREEILWMKKNHPNSEVFQVGAIGIPMKHSKSYST